MNSRKVELWIEIKNVQLNRPLSPTGVIYHSRKEVLLWGKEPGKYPFACVPIKLDHFFPYFLFSAYQRVILNFSLNFRDARV